MQININPINNPKPIFCAQKPSFVNKLGASSSSKVNLIRENCKEVLSKLKYNQPLIDRISSNFPKIKLTSEEMIISASCREVVRLMMPLGATGSLFILQFIEDGLPQKSLILNNNSDSFIEAIVMNNDEEIQTTKFYDEQSLSDFVTKMFCMVDSSLLCLRNFIKGESNLNISSNIDNSINKIQTSKKDVISSSQRKYEYSMSKFVRHNIEEESFQEERNVVPKFPKKLKLDKKDIVSEPAGFIDNNLKSKLVEIRNLYIELKNFLDDKSLSTIVKICNGFEELSRRDSKGFSFNDVKVLFPQSSKFKEDIVTFRKVEKPYFVHMTLSGKIIDVNEEKIHLIRFFDNPKYLSQKSVDTKVQEKDFNDLIDKTLTHLKNFKSYIDNQGWRVRKDKEILEKNYGIINNKYLHEISEIKSKYDNIHEKLDALSYYNSSKIKTAYRKIISNATSRLEFVNVFDDKMNVVFDYSKNKYGEFYKIAKYSGGEDIEKLFLITPDGKIVKNAVKNRGLKFVFPTGGEADIKFCSQEDFEELDLTSLNIIMDKLLKNLTEYEKFILDYLDEKIKHTKNEKVDKNLPKKEITYTEVKKFLDKTARDIQISADKMREAAGFKTVLDSVADDLKVKFEDFLKQFKKN